MAGDPIRDAFRAELAAIIAAAVPPIDWTVRDTVNTTDNPDATEGYFEFEFPGGSERQYSFGAPGANFFWKNGQVTLRVVTPLGRDRDKAETYAAQIRDAFRARRIAVDTRTIRIDSTGDMGGGHTEGGEWAESVALGYSIITTA